MAAALIVLPSKNTASLMMLPGLELPGVGRLRGRGVRTAARPAEEAGHEGEDDQKAQLPPGRRRTGGHGTFT